MESCVHVLRKSSPILNRKTRLLGVWKATTSVFVIPNKCISTPLSFQICKWVQMRHSGVPSAMTWNIGFHWEYCWKFTEKKDISNTLGMAGPQQFAKNIGTPIITSTIPISLWMKKFGHRSQQLAASSHCSHFWKNISKMFKYQTFPRGELAYCKNHATDWSKLNFSKSKQIWRSLCCFPNALLLAIKI